MSSIKKKIIDLVKKSSEGIPLDKYIEVCLFDKDGYYKTSQPIGKKGDFITAPEISQLFGEILGLYIYDLWRKHLGSYFNLVELGSGKGTLIADILRISNNFDLYIDKMNVNLIEINQELINLQKQNLVQNNLTINKINWSYTFDSTQKMPSIIIANEFFDCFPIKQFIKINGIWNEKKINFNKEENHFYLKNIVVSNNSLNRKLDKYAKKNEYSGMSVMEISSSRDEYFNKICKFIKKNSGAAIIFDYGYLSPIYYSTLQSIKHHRSTNILNDPGHQDITSLVNFKSLAEISHQNNLYCYGPYTQRDFLLKNGIEERKNKILLKANKEQKNEVEEGFLKLTSVKEMGEIFKCLIVSSFNIGDKIKYHEIF